MRIHRILRSINGWYDDRRFRIGTRQIPVHIEQPEWFGFPVDGAKDTIITGFVLTDEITAWLSEYCEGKWRLLLDMEKRHMSIAFSRDVDAVKFRLMHFGDKLSRMHSTAYVWTKGNFPRLITEEDYRLMREFRY